VTNRDSEFDHRLSVLEPLRAEVVELRKDFSVLKAGVDSMTDAFKSLRIAIYSASATIMAAAVVVLLLGRV